MKLLETMKPLLIYTMTSGLGDFIVLGDLIGKLEKVVPEARCLILHRDNPHTHLWPGMDRELRFYSVYSPADMLRFSRAVSDRKQDGYTVFGIQMAPGSMQGFLFFQLLKKLGLLHYIVDFNLINADIITPPKGQYILDLHLNQIGELLNVNFPTEFHQLDLPVTRRMPTGAALEEGPIIGVHPWSRRGHLSSFVWPFEKWLELIRYFLSKHAGCRVLVFGRDKSFDSFRGFLLRNLGHGAENLMFSPSSSVNELIETIAGIDTLVTVNTAVVHIGYALRKEMFILNGPSLDLWVPKGDSIHVIRDKKAVFQASDKWENDGNFGSVARIEVGDVIEAIGAAERYHARRAG